jgi:hypothetical protein
VGLEALAAFDELGRARPGQRPPPEHRAHAGGPWSGTRSCCRLHGQHAPRRTGTVDAHLIRFLCGPESLDHRQCIASTWSHIVGATEQRALGPGDLWRRRRRRHALGSDRGICADQAMASSLPTGR